jgi:predicted transposase/invertase (TIGR01784 family)
MLAQKNEVIKDAFDYLQVISKDEEKRLAYEARQLWLMDQRTREKVAREKGREEGEMNKAIEVAKKMLKRKINLEYIAEDTALPLDIIQKLAQSIQ